MLRCAHALEVRSFGRARADPDVDSLAALPLRPRPPLDSSLSPSDFILGSRPVSQALSNSFPTSCRRRAPLQCALSSLSLTRLSLLESFSGTNASFESELHDSSLTRYVVQLAAMALMRRYESSVGGPALQLGSPLDQLRAGVRARSSEISLGGLEWESRERGRTSSS